MIAASLSFVFENAGIAQLVEQLICNQQVVGSNPTAGFGYKFLVKSQYAERGGRGPMLKDLSLATS